MVFKILNIFAVALLVVLTRIVDKKLRSSSDQMGGLIVSSLLLTIEASIFTLTLLFSSVWVESMTRFMLKILFAVDAFFFVTLSFAFISLGANKKNFFIGFFRVICYIVGIYIVFFRFNSFVLNYRRGLYVGSSYLFTGPAKDFFPWTWLTLYNTLFRIILPVMGVLVMFILRERTATPLQRYEAILIIEALVVMLALQFFFKLVSGYEPAFSFLYLYAYIAFFVLVYQALRKTSVPSGRGVMFNILRAIVAYLVPAAFLAVIFVISAPLNKPGFDVYELIVIASSLVAVMFAWKVWDWIMYGSIVATNDYESNFEKGLASIDYKGEMDAVTERMFSVFRNNVECSSLGILVDDGRGKLVTAYSSNGSTFSMQASGTLVFDTLLNNGNTVVIYSEIDDLHDYDNIREPLKALFEEGKFDCMVILNEGHNILGVITLGRKTSGDHYKEYDKNAFIKLYSYFFVFGYYVRNISNKEVLSTVNRELKMSSQIITSIQENVDHIKSHKADVGYLMVPAHNIGGEFIDLIRLTDSRHLIVIGDLSGRGIAASMNMVILKSIIRTYLAETHDFKKLVAKVNVFIRESLKKGTIFSGLFALIDFDTDTMYYINCGVPAMFMYTQVYNNVIEIQGSGHVLGFVKDISPYLSVKTTKLNRGDIILSCTDGLISSHSLRGEKYGRERVSQAVLDNSTYPAQRMAQFTFEGLRKFMSKEMEDDVSIFVLKYKTSAEFATPEELNNKPAAESAVAENAEQTTAETEVAASAENENIVNESVPQPEVSESAAMDFGDMDLPPEALAAMKAAEAFAVGGDEFELPVPDEVVEPSEVPAPEPAPVEKTEELVVPEESVKPSELEIDDFFVEDLSGTEKKSSETEFEFDPKAFGLPDDFTL